MSDGDRSGRLAASLITCCLAVAGLAALFIVVPFDAMDVRSQGDLISDCGSPVTWLWRSQPDVFSSRADRFAFVDCRFQGWFRSLLGGAVGAAAWLVACIIGLGSRYQLAAWQDRALRAGALFFALLGLVGAVGFGVATATNPYPDVARAWTSVLTLVSGLGGILFAVLFDLIRRRGRTNRRPTAVA